MSKPKSPPGKRVEALNHPDAKRKNIPAAEDQANLSAQDRQAIRAAYTRRNRDLDPQLVWRGKDAADAEELIVHAPPLCIQEKVHPKVLLDDLQRQSQTPPQEGETVDLFADFNGLPDDIAKTEFYQHAANWSNRMILGDSLQVMTSLLEREDLRGKVQCIYVDPPYGIKFNSNFQWSTTSREGGIDKLKHITREPEQVKAFRDTWRDGIHSYLSYLRDRLTVARELLTESGSCFVQIGDENLHRVRAVMDEVFGDDNFVSIVSFVTTSGFPSNTLSRAGDYIVWYARNLSEIKCHQIFADKNFDTSGYNRLLLKDGTTRGLSLEEKDNPKLIPTDEKLYSSGALFSPGETEKGSQSFDFEGQTFTPSNGHWKTSPDGLENLKKAGRIEKSGNTIRYIRFFSDFSVVPMNNIWTDTQTFKQRLYVVQTNDQIIQRCLLMTTDPGDLVLDPTCGSGTTAYVAEQWGRRWITIDTSRVALALARARLMGARYPFYLLADSRAGQQKLDKLEQRPPREQPVGDNIRHGFVYQRVPHVTLKSIANNAAIDVIYTEYQQTLDPLRAKLNQHLDQQWAEWQIPQDADTAWPAAAQKAHRQWWQQRRARQQAINTAIAAQADYETLYDKPFEEPGTVRVAGPFSVDSLSPHRALGFDADDNVLDPLTTTDTYDFAQIVLEHLKTAGVQQSDKQDKINFTAIVEWPGDLLAAEGRYNGQDGSAEQRAAIMIGPEFGTLARQDIVAAAKEAADAQFDQLVVCAFNYDALSTGLSDLGSLPIIKARINADLHMASELKNTGQGNLFVVFGEPDIEILPAKDAQIQVKLNGVDIFDPASGKVRSDTTDGIACWFIDTDYDQESFRVRQAYFLGANDPYKALKTTLKAEINEAAWATLNSAISRPFNKPPHGQIAIKVINHLGDEVMTVCRV